MHIQYPRVYSLLKRIGMSPAKAIECMIDVRRGNEFACDWLRAVFSVRHSRLCQ